MTGTSLTEPTNRYPEGVSQTVREQSPEAASPLGAATPVPLEGVPPAAPFDSSTPLGDVFAAHGGEKSDKPCVLGTAFFGAALPSGIGVAHPSTLGPQGATSQVTGVPEPGVGTTAPDPISSQRTSDGSLGPPHLQIEVSARVMDPSESSAAEAMQRALNGRSVGTGGTSSNGAAIPESQDPTSILGSLSQSSRGGPVSDDVLPTINTDLFPGAGPVTGGTTITSNPDVAGGAGTLPEEVPVGPGAPETGPPLVVPTEEAPVSSTSPDDPVGTATLPVVDPAGVATSGSGQVPEMPIPDTTPVSQVPTTPTQDTVPSAPAAPVPPTSNPANSSPRNSGLLGLLLPGNTGRPPAQNNRPSAPAGPVSPTATPASGSRPNNGLLGLLLPNSGGAASPKAQVPAATASAPAKGTPAFGFGDDRRVVDSGILPGTGPARAAPSGPITDLSQLSDLTDTQLFEIFTQGVGEIPSALPSELGRFAVCNRTNALIPNSLGPRLPALQNVSLQGADEAFNAVQQIWNGKIMYTDPATGHTRLWNAFLGNTFAHGEAEVYVSNPGLTDDGKPSIIVDYRNSDTLPARVIRDELRRVGPSIWLGRGFFVDPVATYVPFAQKTGASAVSGAVLTGITDTIKATTPDKRFASPKNFVPMSVYFALDCKSFAVPRLRYFPIQTEPLDIAKLGQGIAFPFFNISGLTGALGIDPNEITLPHKATTEASEDAQPFILWPHTLANPAAPGSEPISGFVQVPAASFAPVFNSSWAPNQAVKGGWDPSFPASQEGFPSGISSVAQNLQRLGVGTNISGSPVYPGLLPVPDTAPAPAVPTASQDTEMGSQMLVPLRVINGLASPAQNPTGLTAGTAPAGALPQLVPTAPGSSPATTTASQGGQVPGGPAGAPGASDAVARLQGLLGAVPSSREGLLVPGIAGDGYRGALAGTAGGTAAALRDLASSSATGINALGRSTIGALRDSVVQLQGPGRQNASLERLGVQLASNTAPAALPAATSALKNWQQIKQASRPTAGPGHGSRSGPSHPSIVLDTSFAGTGLPERASRKTGVNLEASLGETGGPRPGLANHKLQTHVAQGAHLRPPPVQRADRQAAV
eukprot:jgi/Botrbrau1/18619/Bobra.0367s0058.1